MLTNEIITKIMLNEKKKKKKNPLVYIHPRNSHPTTL